MSSPKQFLYIPSNNNFQFTVKEERGMRQFLTLAECHFAQSDNQNVIYPNDLFNSTL